MKPRSSASSSIGPDYVDFGCLAPVEAFRSAFRTHGVGITTAEARGPMGLNKRDHIQAILRMDRVGALARRNTDTHRREADIDAIYKSFIPLQLACIRDFAGVIDGTLETIADTGTGPQNRHHDRLLARADGRARAHGGPAGLLAGRHRLAPTVALGPALLLSGVAERDEAGHVPALARGENRRHSDRHRGRVVNAGMWPSAS